MLMELGEILFSLFLLGCGFALGCDNFSCYAEQGKSDHIFDFRGNIVPMADDFVVFVLHVAFGSILELDFKNVLVFGGLVVPYDFHSFSP